MDQNNSNQQQVLVVSSFDELVNTAFSGKNNAINWQRNLEGDFEEIVNQLILKDDITIVSIDDLNDLSVLQVVGLSAAPANAVVEVKERVQYICQRSGGQGAVRELLEQLLKAQGLWKKVIKEYLQQGQGDVQ